MGEGYYFENRRGKSEEVVRGRGPRQGEGTGGRGSKSYMSDSKEEGDERKKEDAE